jgi:membrane peptidoglycan carboxypeptidase
VKNLFLSRAKTISRKLQEMFITWRIEKLLTKTRIMELYLNIIELGPGIYGIKHAARHYFDKHPAELTLLECVFIASLIPSPNRYYKQFARGEVTPAWRRYLRTLIGIMRQRDKITQEEYFAAAPYSPVFRGQKDPKEDGSDAPIPPVFPWANEDAPGP